MQNHKPATDDLLGGSRLSFVLSCHCAVFPSANKCMAGTRALESRVRRQRAARGEREAKRKGEAGGKNSVT